MASKGGYDKFLKDLNPFSIGLPRTTVLFVLLFVMSVVMGIASVALLNHNAINTKFSSILLNGTITGILVIMLPTLLTIIIVKSVKRYVDMKYIFFISIIGTISYSIFILLGSIVFILTNAYATATAIILVGDASIFAWWFFADKMVLGQKKKAFILALIQPTLNILLYIPSSHSLLAFNTSLNVLLIKLYAGIFIFLVVCYAIIYLVDRPYNKNFGFHSFDAFSQMLQNWLFDVNISAPFGFKAGTPADIQTDTIIFRTQKGSIKSIFFAPDIHYGPAGTLAGSDFPYLLERYSSIKYNAPTFIMHCAVDMDHNPISSTQFNQLKEALDNGVKEARHSGQSSYTFMRSSYKDSKIALMGFGSVSLVTLTRAPKVTEDVSLETALLFQELLESKFGPSIIIDAHNSRYETAPKEELDGVKFNSIAAKEYVKAIRALAKPNHKTKKLRMGIASSEIYLKLNQPIDIAKGNMNVAIFGFNGFKYAMVQFNSNNALPTMRNAMVKHIKSKYGIEAELYTTDTHAVNSLEYNAGNVLGRHTKYTALIKFVDQNIEEALSNMEYVTAQHSRVEMKKFKVWGTNAMENILTVAKSIYGVTRILVPLIIVMGFIIAAWVILII
ncbi:MAG: DUF2070 family protein [Candidatus Micrarchaeaceae archaeon]|jgi:predicted neutral ceramidase superfamily lipid hydrolase